MWKHPLCKKREETKPMTHRLQYIMERALIAASATNPHWHMQPLTVVYGESGPPVWMQRITMAWHSLWINCASWHAQLTVSNSARDLCTAAEIYCWNWATNPHRAGWLCMLSSTLPALIVQYEDGVNMTTRCLLALAAPCLLIPLTHSNSHTQTFDLNKSICAHDYKQDLQMARAAEKGEHSVINQREVNMHVVTVGESCPSHWGGKKSYTHTLGACVT